MTLALTKGLETSAIKQDGAEAGAQKIEVVVLNDWLYKKALEPKV